DPVGDGGVGPDGAVAAPNLDLDAAVASLRGGSATGPGAQAQPGGVVHLLAQGDVTLDPAQAGAVGAAAAIPAAPGGTQAVASDALAADVNAPGSIVISGNASAGGGDAVRMITANGDIFIEGTLRAADLG